MPNISMMGSQNIRHGRSMLGYSTAVWPVQQARNFEAERFFNLGDFCCSTCGEYREPWDECQNFLCASNSDLVRMNREIEESQIVDRISDTLGTVDVNNRTMTVRDRSGNTRLIFGDTTAVRGASADIVGADELLASYETPATDFNDGVEEDSDEGLTSGDFHMESDSGVTSRLDSMETALASLNDLIARMSPPATGWAQANGSSWSLIQSGSISRANVTGVVNPWSNSIH